MEYLLWSHIEVLEEAMSADEQPDNTYKSPGLGQRPPLSRGDRPEVKPMVPSKQPTQEDKAELDKYSRFVALEATFDAEEW
jgi:hypothetical protein